MSVECVCAGILVADHLCEPIDRMPAAGELVLARSLPLEIGGCASNVAIDLARMGIDVGVSGCIGDDVFGRFVRETLEAAGVGTDGIRSQSEVGTSGTLIINVTGEDRRFVHAAGANALFSVADLRRSFDRDAKVLYVGGYLLMPQLEPVGLAKLFREARASGTKTVLDIVFSPEVDAMEALEPLLPETDVFLPNNDEAAAITGKVDPVAQAETFRQMGAETVVITCGEEGTVFISPNERMRAGTYPVEFVGGTGAGDAFDAGYISGLLAGADARTCLTWGSALGASCVRSVAATESVFSREEAQAFIAQHELKFEAI